MNPPSHHHHHHHHQAMALNPKSLKTKFALKFLRALRNINNQENKKNSNNNISSTFTVAQRYHKVKVAAEASMASAIGPRRAWSRAILIRVRARSARIIPMGRGRGRRRRQAGSAQAHEQLRRLVPGGEVMDMKRLLDETAHYIKCLSTQVKVMRGIVNYYSTSTA